MRRGTLALFSLIVALLLPAAAVYAAPADGVVSGKVTNGSSGGASPAGDNVYALIFGVEEQAPLDQKSTTVGPDGSYQFQDLDRDPNLVYLIVVQHQGDSYTTAQPFQLKDQASQTADVTVYDATTSDNSLKLDQLNLLITGADPGMIHAMEMGSVTNAGDRTYEVPNPGDGAAAKGLVFSLPKGAVNAQIQAGFSQQDVVPALSGIQVISPVQPGTHQFAVSFDVPYTGTDADLSIQAPYQAGAVSVYVPAGDMGLNSTSVQRASKQQMGGQTYDLYAASNVNRGTMIAATLVNLPSPSGSGLSPNQLALISLGVVVFVLGAGMLLYSFRPGHAAPAAVHEASHTPEEERLALVLKLAMLDERYERGAVSESEYQEERARGKQRLVELTQTA